MTFVIGGNRSQAEELIRRRRLLDAVVIDDLEPLRGLDAPEVITTGTFIARRDVQAFYDVFRSIGAKHRFLG